MSLTLQLHGE